MIGPASARSWPPAVSRYSAPTGKPCRLLARASSTDGGVPVHGRVQVGEHVPVGRLCLGGVGDRAAHLVDGVVVRLALGRRLQPADQERVGGERVGPVERGLDVLHAHQLLGVVGGGPVGLPGEELESRRDHAEQHARGDGRDLEPVEQGGDVGACGWGQPPRPCASRCAAPRWPASVRPWPAGSCGLLLRGDRVEVVGGEGAELRHGGLLARRAAATPGDRSRPRAGCARSGRCRRSGRARPRRGSRGAGPAPRRRRRTPRRWPSPGRSAPARRRCSRGSR